MAEEGGEPYSRDDWQGEAGVKPAGRGGVVSFNGGVGGA